MNLRSTPVLAALIALPVALLAGVVVFAAMGGFDPNSRVHSGEPVSVTAPPSIAGADAACATLMKNLPKTLAGQEAREVIGAPTNRAAAWGAPPIIIRCGVEKPSVVVGEIFDVEGLAWYATSRDSTKVWTTTQLKVDVEVTVPDTIEQGSAEVINPLAKPIRASIPVP